MASILQICFLHLCVRRCATANQRRQLAGIYVVCACSKKSLRSHHNIIRERKISWWRAPRPPSHNPFCGAPIVVFALGPLGGPELTMPELEDGITSTFIVLTQTGIKNHLNLREQRSGTPFQVILRALPPIHL